jgi:CRP/FNR family transcriptional regulator, cyclic AMP receptor protein
MPRLSLHKNERVALLRQVDLFSGCTNAELGRIAALTTEYRAEAGEVLAKRGNPGLEFVIVVEGRATVSRKRVELATIGPGSFFGELALLDGGPRTATVVAETDMRLLVLSRREFSSIQALVPSVTRKMLAELGARLRKADDLLDPGPVVSRRVGPWSL